MLQMPVRKFNQYHSSIQIKYTV